MGPISVSYTHLDVYKRQAEADVTIIKTTANSTMAPRFIISSPHPLLKPNLMSYLLDNNVPVSYTHLFGMLTR